MEFTEQLIQKYAKKIFGFAYSKTGDYRNAEDLSQDIIIALCDSRLAKKDIDNMDAYVYRVCFYTWSKYLRKNKSHWEMLNNTNVFDGLFSDENSEERYIEKELFEKLKREIVYLSRMRREILIMYYYENMHGKEIAHKLGIPHSTVRYHLRKTKMDLKERIEMNETTGIYKPIRMSIGHSGWTKKGNMAGLDSDVLVQNICYVCYGNAKTIEEIARTLGVAAVYLEDKIEKLLFMDYMKKVGASKYQTNFFIHDEKFNGVRYRYVYDNIFPVAEQFFGTVKSAMTEIKGLDFISADMDDDELMWNILPLFMMEKTSEIMRRIHEKRHLEHARPIRKDGTEHWVEAHLQKKIDTDDKAFEDYMKNSGAMGLKSREEGNIRSLQFDLNIFGNGWRDFDNHDLSRLKRIKEIIESGSEPNEYDKGIIADFVKNGYVRVENGKISILIPYLSADQMDSLRKILRKAADKCFDNALAENFFNGYIDMAKKIIPDFVDGNEKNHVAANTFDAMTSSMYMLYSNGLLSDFDKNQSRRLCTIVWESI